MEKKNTTVQNIIGNCRNRDKINIPNKHVPHYLTNMYLTT